MATKSSKPLADLRARPPEALTVEDYDVLIRTAETHIKLFTEFLASPTWELTVRRLEARTQKLEHEKEGLMRRMCRPAFIRGGESSPPPVTPEQLAYQQGRIEENSDLVNFPRLAIQNWQSEILGFKERQQEIRQRQT